MAAVAEGIAAGAATAAQLQPAGRVQVDVVGHPAGTQVGAIAEPAVAAAAAAAEMMHTSRQIQGLGAGRSLIGIGHRFSPSVLIPVWGRLSRRRPADAAAAGWR